MSNKILEKIKKINDKTFKIFKIKNWVACLSILPKPGQKPMNRYKQTNTLKIFFFITSFYLKEL